MRKTLTLAIICVILTGCCQRHYPPVAAQTDSVRIEYRDRVVRDTVEYELPVIIEKHVTDDTLSVIENDYAKTTAVVHDGHLSHDLQTKPKVLRVPVEVPVRDTVIIEKKAEIREVEVEKKLSFGQKALMRLGWVFITLLAGAVTVAILKLRK